MNNEQTCYLARVAPRYIWWKPPDAAVAHPSRVIARIMDIGVLDDVGELLELFTKEALLAVLRCAKVGQFRDRSWHFRHYYLTGCGVGEVQEPPRRRTYA